MEIVKVHGSWRRIHQDLAELCYNQPSTSTVGRFNRTARRMNAYQVRRSLAFAHRVDTPRDLDWWSACVCNWVRPHRSLRQPIQEPQGNRLYQQRTPAMVIRLTDQIWNAGDLLRCVVYP